MSGALEAFVVTGMKNSCVIKYSRPVHATFSKGVCIGMKTYGRNFGAFEPDWKERVRRFEMKDRGRRTGAGL